MTPADAGTTWTWSQRQTPSPDDPRWREDDAIDVPLEDIAWG